MTRPPIALREALLEKCANVYLFGTPAVLPSTVGEEIEAREVGSAPDAPLSGAAAIQIAIRQAGNPILPTSSMDNTVQPGEGHGK